MSESDVHRRQILTSKVDPRAVKVSTRHMQDMSLTKHLSAYKHHGDSTISMQTCTAFWFLPSSIVAVLSITIITIVTRWLRAWVTSSERLRLHQLLLLASPSAHPKFLSGLISVVGCNEGAKQRKCHTAKVRKNESTKQRKCETTKCETKKVRSKESTKLRMCEKRDNQSTKKR